MRVYRQDKDEEGLFGELSVDDFSVVVGRDESVVSGDRGEEFQKAVSFLQDKASPLYWPDSFQDLPEVEAIDELACMAVCMAGCVYAGGMPCWQLCGQTCAWLVLTPW